MPTALAAVFWALSCGPPSGVKEALRLSTERPRGIPGGPTGLAAYRAEGPSRRDVKCLPVLAGRPTECRYISKEVLKLEIYQPILKLYREHPHFTYHFILLVYFKEFSAGTVKGPREPHTTARATCRPAFGWYLWTGWCRVAPRGEPSAGRFPSARWGAGAA